MQIYCNLFEGIKNIDDDTATWIQADMSVSKSSDNSLDDVNV